MRSSVVVTLFATVLISVFGCGNSPSAEAANKKAVTKPQTITVPPPAPAAAPKADAPKAAAPAPSSTQASATVVKEWNFLKLDKSKLGWTFPGGTPQVTPYGINYQLDAKGKDIGPLFPAGLNIDANEVKTVVVSMFIRQQEPDGKHVPVGGSPLELWFARSEDVVPGDYWKGMKKSFGVAMKPVPGVPDTYVANMASSAEWKGKIDRMHLGVNSDADPAKGKVFVFVRNIRMLK